MVTRRSGGSEASKETQGLKKRPGTVLVILTYDLNGLNGLNG